MKREVAVLLLGATTLVSCDEFPTTLPTPEFESQAIQLLPIGFPVYPKAFSSESLTELVTTQLADVTLRSALDEVAGDICITNPLGGDLCLADVLGNAIYNQFDDAVAEIAIVEQWVAEELAGSLRIYDSQPLSVGVNEQLGQTIASVVDFTGVELTVCVRNRTDELWGVPIRFSLFMGDSQSVFDRTGLVRATEAPEDQAHTFVLQPGETQEITLDAPTLVAALNDVRSLAIDYDAVIEVADLETNTFQSWVSADRTDSDGDGVADSLASWGLVFEELSIKVSGRGDLDVPDNFPRWMQDLVDGDETP